MTAIDTRLGRAGRRLMRIGAAAGAAGTGRRHVALAPGRLAGLAVGAFAGPADRDPLGGRAPRADSCCVRWPQRPSVLRGMRRLPGGSIGPAAAAAASSPAGSWNKAIGACGRPALLRPRSGTPQPAWRAWRLTRPPRSPAACRSPRPRRCRPLGRCARGGRCALGGRRPADGAVCRAWPRRSGSASGTRSRTSRLSRSPGSTLRRASAK